MQINSNPTLSSYPRRPMRYDEVCTVSLELSYCGIESAKKKEM